MSVRFAVGVALLFIGAFSCAEEAEPWRGTVEGFFDAVEAGDPERASAFCDGDPGGLATYLKPGARPEIVGDPVSDGGRVELTVRTPGRPGLTLVLVEKDGDWSVAVEESRSATLASALNAAFGGE
ncbi:MAG TPA: hypothetical protein VM054_04925 [bacterium]|nr:hypothetical protein [bacterium]